jgi:hypothetical protein
LKKTLNTSKNDLTSEDKKKTNSRKGSSTIQKFETPEMSKEQRERIQR